MKISSAHIAALLVLALAVLLGNAFVTMTSIEVGQNILKTFLVCFFPFLSPSTTRPDDEGAAGGLLLIGAGPGRTGTSSLSEALNQLGYHTYHMKECAIYGHSKLWLEAYETRNVSTVAHVLTSLGFNAIVDEPGSSLVPELAEAFPKAQILLTHRSSASGWVASVEKLAHFHQTLAQFPFSHIPRFAQFHKMVTTIHEDRGCNQQLLAGQRDECKEWYRSHQARIKALFLDEEKDDNEDDNNNNNDKVTTKFPPRMLVYSVKEGWEPLQAFLQHAKPVAQGTPFPWVNSGTEFLLLISVARGIQIAAAIVALLVVLGIVRVSSWMVSSCFRR